MSSDKIIDYVQKHPSGKVKIAFTDIDGVLRGKYISAEKFAFSNSALESVFGSQIKPPIAPPQGIPVTADFQVIQAASAFTSSRFTAVS